MMAHGAGGLRFVQISDSHIGFDKPANTDVTATLRAAIAKIKARSRAAGVRAAHRRSDAPLEAGRVRHAAAGAVASCRCRCSTCPASTTCSRTTARVTCSDSARARRAPAGTASITAACTSSASSTSSTSRPAGSARSAPSSSNGWRRTSSASRAARRSSSSRTFRCGRSIPEWGWGTDDSERALSYLKRFGSVSVLNGHIHQVMQKVEGHVTFHTAMSTAFPQPAPGTAPSPGPMKVADDRLRKVLGLSRMSFHDVNHPIAITDVPLETDERQRPARHDVVVDNFSFAPATATVPAGATVDLDESRRCPAQHRQHRAAVQVAGARHGRTVLAPLRRAGDVQYFCSLHPKMTGRIVVG